MEFRFNSLHDFLSMGGHGPYIWACYGIVLLVMLYFGFLPNWRYKQFIREQRRIQAQMQQIAAKQSAVAKQPDQSKS